MRVSWKAKSGVQKVLGAFPAPVADPVYHALQYAIGLKPNVKGQFEFLLRAEELLLGARGRRIEGSQMVELGSGWFPVAPLLMLCLGAKGVHTFDLNRYYSRSRIRAAAEAIRTQLPQFADRSDLTATANSGELPATVHYHPNTRLETISSLAGGPADAAVSRYVLQNVDPGAIVTIHRASHVWMGPEALWIHFVSPSDQRAFTDPDLHELDFVRYGREEWNRIAGNRYGYQNRLRRSQYQNLFAEAGWEIEVDEAKVSAEVIAGLASIPIHKEFEPFETQDLAASHLRFVLGHRGR